MMFGVPWWGWLLIFIFVISPLIYWFVVIPMMPEGWGVSHGFETQRQTWLRNGGNSPGNTNTGPSSEMPGDPY